MYKAISLSILLVFALVLTGQQALAKLPTGVISGTVTDESGAVIANAAINGVTHPIIPVCAPAQRWDLSMSGHREGRSVYEALLVKLQKRFSNHFAGQLSYALQNLDTDYTNVAANN